MFDLNLTFAHNAGAEDYRMPILADFDAAVQREGLADKIQLKQPLVPLKVNGRQVTHVSYMLRAGRARQFIEAATFRDIIKPIADKHRLSMQQKNYDFLFRPFNFESL